MLTRERLQKTSRGWERRPRMINRDTLYFVSTTSPNFCFPEEVSKLAVIVSNISKRWSKWNFASCFSSLENVEKGDVQRPKIDSHVMKGGRKELRPHW